MAIFLEDTAVAKKETFSLNECTEAIEFSCHSLNESIAYSEAAWQNIIITSMKEEYKILSEAKETGDEEAKKSGVGGTIKNFFKKVIEWVKKMFLKIKNFFSNTMGKLLALFGSIENFVKLHENEIRTGASKCEEEIQVSDWYTTGIAQVDGILNQFVAVENKAKSLEDVDAVVKKIIKSDGTKSVKVSSSVDAAINNAKKFKEVKKSISELVKGIEKSLGETDKAAKEGLNSNSEEKSQVAKEKVENGKNKVSSNSKISSQCVKLITRCAKDSHKINVAAYKAYKAGKKATKNS